MGTNRSKWGKIIKLVASLAITVAILYFLISQISLADLKLALSEVSTATIGLTFIMVILIAILRAYRFKMALPGTQLPFMNLTGIVFICNFASNILPFGIGQLSYPLLFKRYFGVPLSHGLPILLMLHVFDLMAVCIIFVASATLAQNIPASMDSIIRYITIMVLLVLVIMIVAVGLVISNHRYALRLQSALERLLARSPGFMKRLTSVFTEGFVALRALNSKALLLKILASSLGIWICMYLIGFIFIRDLNIDIDIATCFTGASLTLVTTILPIQGIGGFGTFEGAWAGVFFLLKLPTELAILSGMMVHIMLIIYQVILGLSGILIVKRYRSRY